MLKSNGLPPGVTVKGRPDAYKASDAAYSVGGNQGTYLARLPRKYPMTPQQRRVKEVAATCGIKRGMSKSALQTAMTDCVGPALVKKT